MGARGPQRRLWDVAVQETLELALMIRALAPTLPQERAAALLEQTTRALRAVERADIADRAVEDIRRLGGLTRFTAQRARELGLRVAVLVPAEREEREERAA